MSIKSFLLGFLAVFAVYGCSARLNSVPVEVVQPVPHVSESQVGLTMPTIDTLLEDFYPEEAAPACYGVFVAYLQHREDPEFWAMAIVHPEGDPIIALKLENSTEMAILIDLDLDGLIDKHYPSIEAVTADGNGDICEMVGRILGTQI